MQVYKNDSTIGSNGTNTTVVFNGYVEKKFSNYRIVILLIYNSDVQLGWKVNVFVYVYLAHEASL